MLNGKYVGGATMLPLSLINLSGRKFSGSPHDSPINILSKFTISIVSYNVNEFTKISSALGRVSCLWKSNGILTFGIL